MHSCSQTIVCMGVRRKHFEAIKKQKETYICQYRTLSLNSDVIYSNSSAKLQPCPDILDSELALPNYSLVRLDCNRHGGGVAIYVSSLFSHNVLLHGPKDLELIVVSLLLGKKLFCVGVLYRPPLSTSDIFDKLCNNLFSLNQLYFSNLYSLVI